MKLKMLLMATCLLLPISSAYAETTDEYVAGLKKEASIGNTEAQKELDQFQALSKKANAGDAQAQYELGIFYQNKAKEYYESVFSHNDYYEQKLQEWLGKAANQGNENAQHTLIAYYKKIIDSNKLGTSSGEMQVKSEAEKKLEAFLLGLVKKDNAEAQYELAMLYSQSNDDEVSSKAGEWIIKASNQGVEQAKIELGKWYLDGLNGISKNYNKAKNIFQELADKGNAEGLFYLAKCYESGLGTPKDKQQAIKLYEQAADDGYIKASSKLSIIFLLDRDTDNYMKYYNKVCSTNQLACIQLQSATMENCDGADTYCMSVFKTIMPDKF